MSSPWLTMTWVSVLAVEIGTVIHPKLFTHDVFVALAWSLRLNWNSTAAASPERDLNPPTQRCDSAPR